VDSTLKEQIQGEGAYTNTRHGRNVIGARSYAGGEESKEKTNNGGGGKGEDGQNIV